MSSFTAEVFQNEFLPSGGAEVNAVVTVTSTAGADSAREPAPGGRAPLEAAVIVVVDASGSMQMPRKKMKAAIEATGIAIDCIRDGVEFGIVAGTHEAALVYPSNQTLVLASPETREQAKQAVKRLEAGGGTAIGSWLTLARWLFGAPKPGRMCHAILLTDGSNEHETPEALGEAIASCEGRFQCDCRGVGTDWEVSELKRIASTLLGTADIVADPADLAADFRSMMETAMGRATASVSLRVWTPQGARVAFLRQVAPTIEDLTDRAVEVDPLTADYPTGAWGDESRDYHVCVHVQPHEVGAEMLAARVSLLEGDQVLSQERVKAIWTDDQQLSTRINREVAHYTGQEELAECIQDGLEARRSGDSATATFKLGRAVQLASESGNDGTLRLLEGVVEVDDAATGTIRLRGAVADVDEMTLDTRSTKTVRVGPNR